jgi:serine palmitoyltransferase
MASNAASRAIVHYAHQLTHVVDSTASLARSVPGSDMVTRYVRSSYQNDPVRSVIELSLFIFVIVYLLKRRFSTEGKNKVVLTEDEIDELIREWQPEPIVDAGRIKAADVEKDEGVVIVGYV